MKRRVVMVLLVLLLLGAAALSIWWFQLRGGEGGDGHIRLYGNVEIRDAQLAFNEQEHVVEVLVEEGDVVQAGQELARLQDDRLQDQLAEMRAQAQAQRQVLRRLTEGTRPQELEQAHAELRAAQARVASAQRRVGRLRPLAREGASSQQGLEDA